MKLYNKKLGLLSSVISLAAFLNSCGESMPYGSMPTDAQRNMPTEALDPNDVQAMIDRAVAQATSKIQQQMAAQPKQQVNTPQRPPMGPGAAPNAYDVGEPNLVGPSGLAFYCNPNRNPLNVVYAAGPCEDYLPYFTEAYYNQDQYPAQNYGGYGADNDRGFNRRNRGRNGDQVKNYSRDNRRDKKNHINNSTLHYKKKPNR